MKKKDIKVGQEVTLDYNKGTFIVIDVSLPYEQIGIQYPDGETDIRLAHELHAITQYQGKEEKSMEISDLIEILENIEDMNSYVSVLINGKAIKSIEIKLDVHDDKASIMNIVTD